MASEKSLILDPRVKAHVIMMRPSRGLLSNQEQFCNLCYSDLLRLVSVPLLYLVSCYQKAVCKI